MQVLIKLSIERHIAGLIHRTESEVLTLPSDITVLNEHGDIEVGRGRKARSFMGREVQSVTYIR